MVFLGGGWNSGGRIKSIDILLILTGLLIYLTVLIDVLEPYLYFIELFNPSTRVITHHQPRRLNGFAVVLCLNATGTHYI